ncbi:MAG: hypothetical protein PHZ11_07515 [Desulfitobacteriaceae bacterium]|nr:hypothetical protein [Desulfitobacteriaceae bacterium]MDD4346717.1 hypothetical protein [Desulfitobacteriaceae bacterium]MDD4402540.1 hypothetical protein [Desulfitobacteriaceae bacterium]
METTELIKQTKNAFNFIEKLYFEVSYLIKEIEGLIQQEDEAFIIGRPSGYGVTTRSSTGLEPGNVSQWLTKTFTVFFCPENMTKWNGGQTVTGFHGDLKVIIIRIVLGDKDIDQPKINFGCLSEIKPKKNQKKFEQLMFEFAYNSDKIFNSPADRYEDSYCAFKKTFFTKDLYSLNNSEDIVTKIIQPVLELYRQVRCF